MEQPLDKNGKPLRGAALQSHLKKRFLDEYLEDQQVNLSCFSQEDKEIFVNAALDRKKVNIKLSRKLKLVSTSLIIACSCGFLTLMVRPNHWLVGLMLGIGIGGGIAIATQSVELDDQI